jgi:two-component system, NarL family, response regulator NreC
MKITIVLADDHQVMRQGLRLLLEAEEGFCVVAEAGDGQEATTLAERLQPDVLIADLMMPGLNGLKVTQQVSQRAQRTHIVILSMYADEAYVVEALRSGASAYVLKHASAAHLLHAVREVAAGRRYLSPPLSEHAIEIYLHKALHSRSDPSGLLTARECKVLQLVAEGNTNAQIAAVLGISPRTVETHRANLMHKLDLNTQADLIRYALQRGIIPLAE